MYMRVSSLLSLLLWGFLPFVVVGVEFGSSPCEAEKLQVPYSSGVLTLDGMSSDWSKIKPISQVKSSMYDDSRGVAKVATLRVTQDGMNLLALVQFDADYRYSPSTSSDECPVVSLLLRIGQDASAFDLGGCTQCSSSTTTAALACVGHEVDVVSFSLCGTIPGRLYSGKSSQLIDGYAYHSSCIGLDGISFEEIQQGSGNTSTLHQFQETQKQFNEWRASWSHSSINLPNGGYLLSSVPTASAAAGASSGGSYTVEFMRALRTEDQLRQDCELSLSTPSAVSGSTPVISVGVNLKLPSGGHTFYRSCGWHELVFQAPLFTISTVYQMTANTVLATVLPVVTAVVLAVVLCVYVRSYVTHVRREFNMRQRLYELRRGGNESDENKENTPPDEMHVA